MNPETLEAIKDETWHRIEIARFASPCDEFGESYGPGTAELHHLKFKVIKTTPKGVWLDVGFSGKRFVLSNAKRQWASPTLPAAIEKFRRRKEKHLAILERQAAELRQVLEYLPEWEKAASLNRLMPPLRVMELF